MEKNIASYIIIDYVDLLKNKEKKREKKQKKTPFYQTILIIMVGLIISFFSQCEITMTYELLGFYLNWNKSKIIISTFEFLIFFLFSSIYCKFKYTKFNIIYLIISILYTINSYIYYYRYSRNSFHFPNIANFWTFIILVIYNLFKYRNNLLRIPKFFFYGMFLGILANIIQLITAYLYIGANKNDEFQFIFHYSDHINNIYAIISGTSSSLIYILMENYLYKKKKIIDSLPHISFYSFILCLIICTLNKEFSFIGSSLKIFPFKSLCYYIVLIFINIILLIFTPFYIHKCSALSYGIICSAELCFKILIKFIFEKNEINLVVGFFFALLIFIFGLGFISYETIKDNSNYEIDNFIEKEYDVKEKLIKNN